MHNAAVRITIKNNLTKRNRLHSPYKPATNKNDLNIHAYRRIDKRIFRPSLSVQRAADNCISTKPVPPRSNN